MNRESKEIFERQNMPELIATQKTASNCYSVGKLWSVILVFISVVIPVIINIILFIFNIKMLSACLIFTSFICFGLSELLRLKIKKWKFFGAGMQQYFDEFVFKLKNTCRKYICPKKLSQFERSKLIKKFEKKDNKRFQNWYSNFTSLSYENAVYQCQKQNIRWDIYVRKNYLIFLVIISILIIVVIILNSIIRRMNILLVIAILSSLVPIGSFLYNGIKKLYNDIKSQSALYEHIESIESKQTNKELWDEIEELQIEIYNYRKQAYLIPNWFYKLSRNSKQKEEDYFAKSFSKTNNDD